MRLLIADDEALLRAWLRRLLGEVAPDAQIVAEAADGTAALAEIERLRPDAAFLDISMPGLSGLEVAARITVPCRTVFVTAYDEFAVQAFEQAAADYLLKPVTAERLAKTWQRLQQPAANDPAALIRELLAKVGLLAASAPATEPLRWLRIGVGETVQLVDVNDVDYFAAADKYTMAHGTGREWLIRTSLKELKEGLDAQRFWRIHRGTVVRADAIAQVRRDLMGRLWVELKDGGKALSVSRSFAHLFRQM
ncbi:MAG: LytTR family DNA-binding domain-containing protein [Rhodocyclaceae bacterium]|nr:LytTR family DNA-binding domain-containing protein [Rhodocyclaceae bacterium]